MWGHRQRRQMKGSSPKCFISFYKTKITDLECRSMVALPFECALLCVKHYFIHIWSRCNFVFKCWICHFGSKLFDCKRRPAGAGLMHGDIQTHQHSKGGLAAGAGQFKVRKTHVWNGTNVTLYSTRLCAHARTHTLTRARSSLHTGHVTDISGMHF